MPGSLVIEKMGKLSQSKTLMKQERFRTGVWATQSSAKGNPKPETRFHAIAFDVLGLRHPPFALFVHGNWIGGIIRVRLRKTTTSLQRVRPSRENAAPTDDIAKLHRVLEVVTRHTAAIRNDDAAAEITHIRIVGCRVEVL